MSEEQCCCFCLNLRTGSYLSAGYSIAFAIILLIPYVLVGSVGGTTSVGIVAWVTVVLLVLWLIFSIILIVGVSKNSRGWLIPWVVVTIIVSVILVISVIVSLVNAEATFQNSRTIAAFIITCVCLALNIYALWCVISLHKRNMNP